MLNDVSFIPGHSPKGPRPLDRFLPPIPDGVVTQWMRNRASKAKWVLDPFGSAPMLPIELARAGYPVIVVANNPISRFLLEMFAEAPPEREFQIALAEIASLRRGTERLEPHIRSLYLTTCNQCSKEIEAQSFVWERDTNSLVSKIYHCPFCGESGEFPVLESDIMLAAHFSDSRLHQARSLERVTSIDDPDRHHVEEALSTYLPRAMYALITIINKLDGLDISPARRRHIHALLLSACDYSNNLWAKSTRRPRPKQLTAPPHYFEHNVWLALETAISQWTSQERPVPVSIWPENPPNTGGISIYEGRIKQFADALKDLPIDAVLAALPRPNQAFWTLSTLWAGWLWGHEAIGPFKSVLRRRRYDWGWHCEALYSAFSSLYSILKPGTPVFGILGEAEPGFISAALISAETANLELRGMALRAERGHAQISWSRPEEPRKFTYTPDHVVSRSTINAAVTYLRQRAEPITYVYLQSTCMDHLIREQMLITSLSSADPNPQSPSDSLSHINSILGRSFFGSAEFKRYKGSDKSLEAGKWWLNEFLDTNKFPGKPISDRIEIELIRYLLNYPKAHKNEIDAAMCATFPGFFTPNEEFINICLTSYGEQIPPDSQRWCVQEKDWPRTRRRDVSDIGAALNQIGMRLGYKSTGKRPLMWIDEYNQIAYVFYIYASTAYSEIIFSNQHPPSNSILVIPGGRAVLAIYKQRQNPFLAGKLSQGWRYLKFRHVHHLAETPFLTRENLDQNLALDPITVDTSQLRLL